MGATVKLEKATKLRRKAVSVHHLANDLIQETAAVGQMREAKVYEIEPTVIRPKGEKIVCPRDGIMGSAYVDALEGEDHVGDASFMLSYTWGYEISDIADALVAYCRDRSLDAERTYVWICCLCINQHRVKAMQAAGEVVPFDEFQSAFSAQVRGVGKVLALMAPWQKPRYLTRVWCVFEMYTAVSMGKKLVEVEIIMPPRESASLCEELKRGGGGVNQVWNTLGELKVENAEASYPEDRINILKVIESSGAGFEATNNSVIGAMQSWFADASETYAREAREQGSMTPKEVAKLFAGIGQFLRDTGRLSRADALMCEARSHLEESGELVTTEGAELLRKFGTIKRGLKALDDAIALYEEAHEIYNKVDRLESDGCAQLMMNMGVVKRQQNDFDGAEAAYAEARKIREANGSMQTNNGALLLNTMGTLQREKGDLDGALKLYEESKAIRGAQEKVVGPNMATCLANIGTVKQAKGDIDGAHAAFHEARLIRTKTGTLNTPDGKFLQKKIRELPAKSATGGYNN